MDFHGQIQRWTICDISCKHPSWNRCCIYVSRSYLVQEASYLKNCTKLDYSAGFLGMNLCVRKCHVCSIAKFSWMVVSYRNGNPTLSRQIKGVLYSMLGLDLLGLIVAVGNIVGRYYTDFWSHWTYCC